MIRLAAEPDIPRLVEMGRRFREETGYRAHIAENPAKMAQLAAQLAANGGLLVSERDGRLVGMLGYILFDHFLSGEMVAGEVFWWVEPEHRGAGVRLLIEAERRARAAGASRMQMIAPTDKVGQFYQRVGYEYVESAYQKNL
jgi:GNAT superfamily N-acetyltransferase